MPTIEVEPQSPGIDRVPQRGNGLRSFCRPPSEFLETSNSDDSRRIEIATEPAADSGLRILHVEDNSDDAELILQLLHAQGIECRVERVQTREKMLAALRRGQFDLILSDFTLAGFDGLSALELAREYCPKVPFLFVTGTLGEETAVNSLQRGATDYVLKDRPSRLGAAIRRAMEEVKKQQVLRQAEEAMVQSESKYRQLFECLAEAAVLADPATGRILDANKQAEVLLGRTRGEIIGLNQNQFLKPATLQEFHRRFSVPASAPSRIALKGEVQSKDGEVIPVTISATLVTLYNRRLVLALYRHHDLP